MRDTTASHIPRSLLRGSSFVRAKQRLIKRLMAVSVFFSISIASSSQAITISPVIVELSPAHRIVAITVSNESDSPVTLQADTIEWTQSNGHDLEKETNDLLVVPPLAEIQPGDSQIFRVTLRQPSSAVAERAYRLVLDDVSEIKRKNSGVGVTFNFSHRLPVFVAGVGKVGPKPQIEICSAPAVSVCVRLKNLGDRFVLVKRITAHGQNWHKELAAAVRILAGAWKQWTFERPAKYTGSLTINVETSVGPLSVIVPGQKR